MYKRYKKPKYKDSKVKSVISKLKKLIYGDIEVILIKNYYSIVKYSEEKVAIWSNRTKNISIEGNNIKKYNTYEAAINK